MHKQNSIKDIIPKLVLVGKDADAEHQILQFIRSELEGNFSYSVVNSIEPILSELLFHGSPNAAQESLSIISEVTDKIQNGFLQNDPEQRESILKLFITDLFTGIQKRSPHPYFMEMIKTLCKQLIGLLKNLDNINEISKTLNRIAQEMNEPTDRPKISGEVFQELKVNLKYFQRKLTLDDAIGNPDHDKLS
jgi:hypothetical protein